MLFPLHLPLSLAVHLSHCALHSLFCPCLTLRLAPCLTHCPVLYPTPLALQMFLNNKILRHACEAKIQLEAAVAQRLVVEGRRELDAKRSMVRHVSHEIRYGLYCWWCW